MSSPWIRLVTSALACSLGAVGCGRIGFDAPTLEPGSFASVLDNVDDSKVEYVYGPLTGRGFVGFADAVYQVAFPSATQISDTYATGADAPGLLTLADEDQRLFFVANTGNPARKLFAVDRLASRRRTTAADAQTDIVPGWDDEIGDLEYDANSDVLYIATRTNVFRWKPLEVSSAAPLALGDRMTKIGFGGTIDLPYFFDGQLYVNASRGCGYGYCGEYALFRVGPNSAPLVAGEALTDTRAADYHNDYPTDLIGDPMSHKLYFTASTQGNGMRRDVFVLGPTSSLPVLAGDALTTVDKADGFPDCATRGLDRSRGLLYTMCRTATMDRFELMRGDVTTIEATPMDASTIVSNLNADYLAIVAQFDDGTAIVRADFATSSEYLRLTLNHTNSNKLAIGDKAIDLDSGGTDTVTRVESFADHDLVVVVGESSPGQQRLYYVTSTSTGALGPTDFVSALAPDGNDDPQNFILDPSAEQLYFKCRTDVDVYRVCRWTVGGPVVSSPLFQINEATDDPTLLGFLGDYLVFVADNANGGRSLHLYNPAAE